jgi:hypothetical protein
MKKVLALFTLIVLATFTVLFLEDSSMNETSFDEWKSTYSINFDESELVYRRIIFERNLLMIAKHNADPSQTYKMGVNQFTAFTQAEFEHLFFG